MNGIPVLHAEGDCIARAWENALIELHTNGCRIKLSSSVVPSLRRRWTLSCDGAISSRRAGTRKGRLQPSVSTRMAAGWKERWTREPQMPRRSVGDLGDVGSGTSLIPMKIATCRSMLAGSVGLFLAAGVWAGEPAVAHPAGSSQPGLVFAAANGPGAGRHVVLLSGDEEYRSEEALPMLARILAARQGFKCTVLFAINRQTGEIDPNTTDNIPGLEALAEADLMIVFLRFRDLPDEQMRFVDAYLNAGKPVIGIRPSVVAFRNKPGSRYEKYSCDYQGADFVSGFGQQILGSTWISHHGDHGKESTRGVLVEAMKSHPILRGVQTLWGPTDVYTIKAPIPRGGQVLVMGQVLTGMNPEDPPSDKAQMPLAWTTQYTPGTRSGRVFMTTMGASQDFENTDFRRMIVNACYWALGLEGQISVAADVRYVGAYTPTGFGFNKFRKGVRPADLAAQAKRETPTTLNP